MNNSGIENRPLIAGNLLEQPFLKNYKKKYKLKNANFIHNNSMYIGNNQFVNSKKILKLKKYYKVFLMKKIKVSYIWGHPNYKELLIPKIIKTFFNFEIIWTKPSESDLLFVGPYKKVWKNYKKNYQ